MPTMKKDEAIQALAERFLASVDEAIQSGDLNSWERPWKSCRPTNVVSGHQLTGMNWLLLASAGIQMVATFKQWKSIGCPVRKGEQSYVTLLNPRPFVKTDEDGAETKGLSFRPMAYFTIEQVEPLDPEDVAKLDELKAALVGEAQDMTEVEANAEKLLNSQGPRIMEGYDGASYAPEWDEVRMPERRSFESNAAYLATLAHEIIHSTGAKSRLNRDGVARFDSFGSRQYAYEELIAEIGSGMLCSHLGIESRLEENHAPYLAHWKKIITDDANVLAKAATEAKKAVELVLSKGAA